MLTLILPVRDWPQERIDLCLKSYQDLSAKSISEIIVVDFGSQVPVCIPEQSGIRLLRLEAQTWSLSEAINAGVAVASNELIAKTDADILISRNSRAEFDAVVRTVAKREVGVALAQATDLPASLSPAQAYALIVAERSDHDTAGRLRPKWGQGGLVFFTRSNWNEVGGFESRFTGWGNEDNDFAERIGRAGRRVMWADRRKLSILHMWHPPSYAATGVLSHRQRNQKIARDDKSIFRPMVFRHSNFAHVAAPAVIKSLAPLVTLGIATTARPNRNRMITEAVNSFRDQIDNDFEVLVVDNGSPEEATRGLKSSLGRIRWANSVRLEALPKGSIPAARNAISRLARGRYICVVDDDDVALPNRLADHLQVFSKDGNVHGSHGGWIDFDESTGVIERNQGKRRLLSTLLKGTGKITAHPASFYRADVMRAIPYDESFALGSDFDLALRLANNGFEVPHTNSYLTLRRYHSANVTITGQANQVSNGVSARSRTLASLDWQRLGGLEEEAKSHDDEVYCRNQMSIDSIADLIPGYSGAWRIYAPISALVPPHSILPSPNRGGQDAAAAEGIVADASALAAAAVEPLWPEESVVAGKDSRAVLQQLLDIVPGDLCTRHSGLNQPICFRSASLAGLKRARKVKNAVEELLGLRVQLNSVRQAQIDREVPFDWKAMSIKSGERVLQSAPFTDLSTLLEKLGDLNPDSLLRSSLSVMSDYTQNGETYFLVTGSIKGYDNVRNLAFELERRLNIPFRHVAAQGISSELTPNTRSH